MGLWVTEIGEYTIAHVFCHEAIEPAHLLRHRRMVGTDHVSHVLGVEARRQRR